VVRPEQPFDDQGRRAREGERTIQPPRASVHSRQTLAAGQRRDIGLEKPLRLHLQAESGRSILAARYCSTCTWIASARPTKCEPIALTVLAIRFVFHAWRPTPA
jgi:hypothetical protein